MGSPGAKASASGSPSAGKADFVLTQTHLFFASLGQHLFGCTAEKAGRIFQCISEFMSDFGPYNQGLGRSIFFGAPLGTDEARAREKIHLSLARLSKAGSGWQVRTHGRRYRRLSGPEALAAGLAPKQHVAGSLR
jgi:hypothetical protein